METRVSKRLIRSKDGGGGGGGSDSFREGDKVEADFRGRGKFYPGKIRRDRGDDTYDIDYEDGERESRVNKRLIRSKDGSGGGGGGRLMEGDKVEADYRGRGKFYPGKIRRDRGDDTYDIDYEDGARETRVSKRLIRSKDGGGGGGRLSEGDKVEARYRGREKYYPGKISRDRGDGTYDISYDDGERETRVEESLIRKVGGSRSRSPSPSRGRLREGARVEARYRGRSKFYPGKISRDRGDGTFDIAYDDGESETRVAEDLIKAAGGGSRSPSPSRGRLREGARVEARCVRGAEVSRLLFRPSPPRTVRVLATASPPRNISAGIAAARSSTRAKSRGTAATGPSTSRTTTANPRRAWPKT